MHNPNDYLTLAALARAEIKVIRPALMTCTTNHIGLAGTLPSISVTFLRVVRSYRATIATCMKNIACQYATNIYKVQPQCYNTTVLSLLYSGVSKC